MSDADLVIAFTLVLSLTAGAIGGLLAGWLRNHAVTGALKTNQALEVAVQLHAQPVQLDITTRQPAPVVVEVITAGTPALRERAARTIAVFPTIGPSDLAQICQCSKSTAWAIIRDARSGKLDLPDIPDPDDEEE